MKYTIPLIPQAKTNTRAEKTTGNTAKTNKNGKV